MKIRSTWRTQGDQGQRLDQPVPATAAANVLRFLTPDLLGVLASLHGAPQDLAEAAVQLLPFGSRAALETTDPPMATAVGDECDGYRTLRLTDFAFDVMAEAAAAAESNPEAVNELHDRAAKVVASLGSRRDD